MKILALFLALAAAAICSEPQFAQPIPELRLPNGTVFRNVTVVRYEKERVILKSNAGVGGIPYYYVSEPLRSKMIAERDVVALAEKAEQQKAERVAAAAKAAADDEREQKSRASSETRRRTIEDAIRRGVLVVGMTESDVSKSWGGPGRRNTSGGSHGGLDQWVYTRPDGTTYLYFRDGLLDSWQKRERRQR
jgi:hypothetical protein